jgi:hypothetical protein
VYNTHSSSFQRNIAFNYNHKSIEKTDSKQINILLVIRIRANAKAEEEIQAGKVEEEEVPI